MKSVQDAIYNWLTIKIVRDARPDDIAAKETTELFEGILMNDHGASNIHFTKDDSFYHVSYDHEGETQKKRFPIELIEVMLNQINENPEKYESYPIEE